MSLVQVKENEAGRFCKTSSGVRVGNDFGGCL